MSERLGDRMKLYESAECGRRFMPFLPILARVDGRAFHSFTRGMQRPFDPAMQQCMLRTAIALTKETNASIVYTQSDEISLAWHVTDPDSEVWFGGRISKMVSLLAAEATLAFYEAASELLPAYVGRRPRFDARVWQVPNRTEAANAFLWRELDAIRNSITMAARVYFSDRQLHGVNGLRMIQMLKEKGVDWHAYPDAFKRGVYVQRRAVERPFTAEELAQLPPKHAARQDPTLIVRRSVLDVVALPPLRSIANREAVIFDGAEPALQETFAEASVLDEAQQLPERAEAA